jgi:putative ABC transport system permease protein
MLASVGGVAFAIVLMFIEMGFTNGLYDTEIYVINMLNADLVLVGRYKEATVPKLPFPKKRLVQARAVTGVEATYPLYVNEYRSLWKNAVDGKEHPILVFAFDPDDPVFLIPEVVGQAYKLKVEDTVLIDSQSRHFFGGLAEGTQAELSRHTVRIVGTFPLGADFRVDGTILVSDRTFFKCISDPRYVGVERSQVEFGLIRVASGYEAAAVRDALLQALPNDIQVLTRQELAERVKEYWGNSKPVGYVFGLGTFVGFLIGVTICYQVLYTDIVDHLPQFATLRAIGYHNRYLIHVVLQEALFLGIIGFLPGMLCSMGVYAILQAVTGIRMQLTVGRIVLVFVLALVMCALSGIIAIRKAINSDPADVF